MPNTIPDTAAYQNAMTNGEWRFHHLPAFAAWLKSERLEEYVREQIRLSYELDLPMLRYLSDISEDELFKMSIISTGEYFTALVENRIREHVENSLKLWMADGFGIIKRHEISAKDILLASYLRKRSMTGFLSGYTTDVALAINIIREIDELAIESDIAFSNVYISLLRDRIVEQAKFTEVVANTTPGINYTFDLATSTVKYANANFLAYFGYSREDIERVGNNIMRELIYPEDIVITQQELMKFAEAADGEIISWELRLKSANGAYAWMRNYSSVFKRDEQGAAAEIVGIILDVSKEKDATEKLRIREHQLLDAQAQARVGSFEVDLETGKMEVTPQFAEIFEQTQFDMGSLNEKVHPDDKARVAEKRSKAIQDDTQYDNEYRYLVNGKEKIIRSRGITSYKNGRKIMSGTVMDVTDRHHMIRRLVESEERLRKAQELALIGNWKWYLATDECTWSDEMFRIYEMEVPEHDKVRPEQAKDYRHPDDIKMVEEITANLFQRHIPCDYIFRIIIPSTGSVKHLNVKAEVAYDEDKKPVHIFGTIQDVSEKQSLIERLQRSEQLYKQAQAISHIGNWTWDMKTRQVDWSDEVYRIYELPAGSIKNITTLDEYNHPDDQALISDSIRKAIELNQPFDFDYRIVLPGNRAKVLHAKGDTSRSFGNMKIYGTLQDITGQKAVEKQIRDYKEFVEKIMDVTPSIIASYNIHTGKYSFVNDAIEKLLGYPVTKVMEEGVAFFSGILHPEDVSYLLEKNALALEEANKMKNVTDEPVTEFKYRMLNASGEYRWFHTYGTVFERNDKGEVESVLNVSVDITEQESAEQLLYQKNIQLQQSNTSLEEYAYVASHDLKEPLRKIATFSDRILTTQYDALNADGQLYLNKIIDASKRMQKMVSDLLSVSTISGNNAFEPCDLKFLLEDAIVPLEYKIEEGKATIEWDDLPTIPAVPSQFRQLFQNLVGNSLKFGREDVPVHIKITHRYLAHKAVERFELPKAKKYLQIQLQDNGIGFANEYAGKIFTIFQRLHGKNEYDGTGIGLAICKKIIENHGGVIYAEGVPGSSATFTIIIPL